MSSVFLDECINHKATMEDRFMIMFDMRCHFIVYENYLRFLV